MTPFQLRTPLSAQAVTMPDTEITPEVIKEHGITPEEYEHILEILGREPTSPSCIFSVMRSEHCSYKNTRALLKTFPTRSPKVIVAAGEENAGVIDMGDGLVAFKIESQPSQRSRAVSGAATGVGGIIRDIFTMGVRPIANEFAEFGARSPTVRRLFRGVVAGIAHYGNCIGLPTVAEKSFCPLIIRWLTPSASGCCATAKWHAGGQGRGQPGALRRPGDRARRLAGAAFASQDLTEESADNNAALCRWATRSWRNSARPASSCWRPARSREYRTWAQPA